ALLAVAALPLAAGAAGARVVAAARSVLDRVERPDVRRRAIGGEQPCHRPHRPVDVVEKRLVAGAEVVEAGVAVGRLDEAVLRAAAVAGEAHVALEAEPRQRVALVEPEPLLLRRC